MLRGLIIAAIVGFPIAAVLAWIYDITAHGIVVQGETTDTDVPPLGGRKTDFVIIGILSAALVFSIYLNISDESLIVAGRSSSTSTMDFNCGRIPTIVI